MEAIGVQEALHQGAVDGLADAPAEVNIILRSIPSATQTIQQQLIVLSTENFQIYVNPT